MLERQNDLNHLFIVALQSKYARGFCAFLQRFGLTDQLI
jgi:hypothetical protein